MKKILITGSSRGLGKEIYDALCQSDIYKIKTIGRSSSNDIFCDLSELKDVTLLLEYVPDIVIHLAAEVPNRKLDTIYNAQKTELIDKNIFNACEKWAAKTFYFSGCRLYSQNGAYVDESTKLENSSQSPYLEAKKKGDILFQKLKESIVFRVSLPITSDFSNDNILSVFKNCLDTEKQLTVFNEGEDEQDFVDSRTIIETIIFLLDKKIDRNIVLNLCNGVPVKMKTLAENFIEILGGQISYKADSQKSKIYARYSNNKLKNIIPSIVFYNLEDSLNYYLKKSSLGATA